MHYCILVVHEDEKTLKETLDPFSELNKKYFKPFNYTSTLVKDWVNGSYDYYDHILEKALDEELKIERPLNPIDPYTLTKKAVILHNEKDLENVEYGYSYTEIDPEIEAINIEGYKFIRMSNPKGIYDWWELGGRYGNRFLLRRGGEGIRLIQEKSRGFGSPKTIRRETVFEGKVVQCMIKDLDFKTMHDNDVIKYSKEYNELLARYNNSEKDENNYPKDFDLFWDYGSTPRKYDNNKVIFPTKQEYLDFNVGLGGYGIIYNGKYFERPGNDLNYRTWINEHIEVLKHLPVETLVSSVDIHS